MKIIVELDRNKNFKSDNWILSIQHISDFGKSVVFRIRHIPNYHKKNEKVHKYKKFESLR